MSPDIFDLVYFLQTQTDNCFFCVLVTWIPKQLLLAGNFCYIMIISAVTDSVSLCAKKSHVIQNARAQYAQFNILSDIIEYSRVKWQNGIIFLFFHSYLIIFTNLKNKYAILVFLIYIQCYLLINLETCWKKDAFIWRDWDTMVAISLFTSVNTRLQLLSKNVWVMIHKTSTHVNTLLLPIQ